MAGAILFRLGSGEAGSPPCLALFDESITLNQWTDISP